MATHPAPLSGIAEDGHGDDDDELSSSSGSDGHGSDDARGEDARAPRRFDSALQSSGVFSRGGSWYFMPGDPGDAAPPGPPPNLAYWMPPDDPHAPGHWGDSSQLSVQESLAGAAFVPYPMPPAGGDPSQSYSDLAHLLPPEEEFKVYPSRWVMLFYMSLLNLLSDWTCFSVAPIATLTTSAFDLGTFLSNHRHHWRCLWWPVPAMLKWPIRCGAQCSSLCEVPNLSRPAPCLVCSASLEV